MAIYSSSAKIFTNYRHVAIRGRHKHWSDQDIHYTTRKIHQRIQLRTAASNQKPKNPILYISHSWRTLCNSWIRDRTPLSLERNYFKAGIVIRFLFQETLRGHYRSDFKCCDDLKCIYQQFYHCCAATMRFKWQIELVQESPWQWLKMKTKENSTFAATVSIEYRKRQRFDISHLSTMTHWKCSDTMPKFNYRMPFRVSECA